MSKDYHDESQRIFKASEVYYRFHALCPYTVFLRHPSILQHCHARYPGCTLFRFHPSTKNSTFYLPYNAHAYPRNRISHTIFSDTMRKIWNRGARKILREVEDWRGDYSSQVIVRSMGFGRVSSQ